MEAESKGFKLIHQNRLEMTDGFPAEEPRAKNSSPRYLQLLLFVILTVLLVVWWGLASAQAITSYDDESIYIEIYQRFLTGSRLPSDLKHGYGPLFPWVFGTLLWLFGMESGPGSLRLLNFIFCSFGSLAIGRLSYSLNGNRLASVNSAALALLSFSCTLGESGHPNSALFCFFSFGLLACAQRSGWSFGALGVITVLAIAIKVNIGALFFASIGWHVLACAPRSVWIRILRAVWILCTLTAPFLLIQRTPQQPNRWFIPMVMLCLVTPFLLDRTPLSREDSKPLRAYVLGLIGACLGILTIGFIGGVSPEKFLNAVLFKYLSGVDRSHWFAPSPWGLGSLLVMLIGTSLWFLNRKKFATVLAVVSGLTVYLCISSGSPFQQGSYQMPLSNFCVFMIPAMALLWSNRPKPTSEHSYRLFHLISSVAILQPVALYPIPGGQKSLAFVFMIPLAVNGFMKLSDRWRPWFLRALFGVLLLRLAFQSVVFWQLYDQSSAPLFPSRYSLVRTRADFWLDREWVVYNLAQNADSVLTYPPTFSLAHWAQRPARELAVTVNWFRSVPKEKVSKLLDSFKKERLVVVSSAKGAQFRRLPPLSGRYGTFLEEECATIARSYLFTIKVPRRDLADFKLIGAWWVDENTLEFSTPKLASPLSEVVVFHRLTGKERSFKVAPGTHNFDPKFKYSIAIKGEHHLNVKGLDASGKLLFRFPVLVLSREYRIQCLKNSRPNTLLWKFPD